MIPCARCPSPILDGAPRFSEMAPSLDAHGIGGIGLREYHPGCWAAEMAEGARS